MSVETRLSEIEERLIVLWSEAGRPGEEEELELALDWASRIPRHQEKEAGALYDEYLGLSAGSVPTSGLL